MFGPINNYPPQKSCLRTPFNQKQNFFWVISLFMPGNIVICTFLGLKSKMAILARTIAPSNFYFLVVLFLFPVCKNGGVGINLFFLLCTVQVLQRVKGAGFLAKCAFSALKIQIAISGKNIGPSKFSLCYSCST